MLTGKALFHGGPRARTEATGYGNTYFVQAMLATKGESFDGKRVVVSGSGNVAICSVEKVQSFGGKVVAVSDSSGYIVDEVGIDLALLKQIKEVRRGRSDEYRSSKAKAAAPNSSRPAKARSGMCPAMWLCPRQRRMS